MDFLMEKEFTRMLRKISIKGLGRTERWKVMHISSVTKEIEVLESLSMVKEMVKDWISMQMGKDIKENLKMT